MRKNIVLLSLAFALFSCSEEVVDEVYEEATGENVIGDQFEGEENPDVEVNEDLNEVGFISVKEFIGVWDIVELYADGAEMELDNCALGNKIIFTNDNVDISNYFTNNEGECVVLKESDGSFDLDQDEVVFGGDTGATIKLVDSRLLVEYFIKSNNDEEYLVELFFEKQ